MTKKIGLPFWKVGDNSFGSTLSYIMYAERFGEVIPLMPNHTVREDLDLLILPGGADVDPWSYGERPDYFTGKTDLFKEHFDKVYLPQYIANGTSILGICRGHQALGVAFGAKLIQHMSHETNDINKDPYSAQHNMQLALENFNTIERFSGHTIFSINSRHHQVIDENTLPEELVVLAYHKSFDKRTQNGSKIVGTSDGSIEMIAHKELPVVGIQFHIEDTINAETVELLDNIVEYLINEKKSILL